MINYFKKILTGYHTVKKKVSGVEVTFSYSDKPIFFDPFSMIQEFKHRSSEGIVQRLNLQLPFSESLLDFAVPDHDDLPNVICRSIINGSEFKISRFSLKDGIYPISFYRFELDGTLIGTFRRKYDYGSQIQKMASELAQKNHSEISSDKESWLWENELGEKIFLEKYGHSQVWSFANSNLMH